MIEPLSIQVRFSDIDSMGHVNNAVYLSYFEMARVYYFKRLLGDHWDWKRNGIILARTEIEYLKPLFIDNSPSISMHLETIGNKSFVLNYSIAIGDDIVCKGNSKIVYYNFIENKSKALDDKLKQALLKLQ